MVPDAAARAEVDLRGGAWPVRDQGTTGACIGFAAADGVLHWHYRQAGLLAEGERPSPPVHLDGQQGDHDLLTSFPTTFIESAGTQIKLALRVARKYGCVLESTLPMDGTLSSLSTEAFYARAARYRIASYHNLGRRTHLHRPQQLGAAGGATAASRMRPTPMPRAPSTRPTARYSERAVERRLRLYFPEYRELPIVPAFSSLSIPDDSDAARHLCSSPWATRPCRCSTWRPCAAGRPHPERCRAASWTQLDRSPTFVCLGAGGGIPMQGNRDAVSSIRDEDLIDLFSRRLPDLLERRPDLEPTIFAAS